MDSHNIKVIVSDLDGTLLNDDKIITQETADALIEAQKQGYKVVIATGRGATTIQKYAKQIQLDKYGGYMVGFNGQHVYDFSSSTLHETHEMEPEIVQKAIHFAKKNHLQVVMENKEGYYIYTPWTLFPLAMVISLAIRLRKRVGNKPYHLFTKHSVPSHMKLVNIKSSDTNIGSMPKMGFSQLPFHITKKRPLIMKEFSPLVEVTQVASFWFDLVPKGANKSEGLEWVSEQLQIPLDQFIAFGDAENDVVMLKRVGVGVAMNNAMAHVKSSVDVVSEFTNNESGVGRMVDQLLKGTFVVK